MPPERPVPRLTFPAREPGARKIMAGKLQVGVCLADHLMRWQASLWSVANRPSLGRAGIVRGPDLASLRDGVRKQLADEGLWWSVLEPRDDDGDDPGPEREDSVPGGGFDVWGADFGEMGGRA